MIYSRINNPAPPPSCNRIVNGIVTYEVVGWSVELKHIGFLLPMTIIILIALTLIIIAWIKGDKTFLYEFEPIFTSVERLNRQVDYNLQR
jgi:hypothetical protein